MGFQMKPCAIVVTSVLVVCILVGVGYLGYSLKLHGDKDSEADSPRNETLEGQPPATYLIEQEHLKCEGADRSPEEKCNIRLDPNVLPLHYDIYLFPNISSGNFTGEVSIELEIQSNSVDHIRLHTKYLDILSTELKFGGTDFPVIGSEYGRHEYWVVRSAGDHVLTKGTYTLRLKFGGSLTRGIVGFYRSSYYDKLAKTSKFVVSSKFQPTYARRAFPCFDEPGFKSTFSVSIVKPSELVALSNMPVAEEKVGSPSLGLTTVRFQKSVPMVTYLVSFAIGDFAYKESVTKRGVPVRIYATSFLVQHTQYASNITAKIVDFFEEYFAIDYPLPKLDVIGIPDFVSGAMEHWGMISFREANLLYQPGVASAFNKQRVAAVLAHELAHMWFGNLMTLKWWNDLWLNEGFASYMEYKGVNAVQPDWDMETQVVGDDLTPVLRLDGQRSSHPIVQQVSHPDQITEIFDRISYSKGASVIRMLENFMGREQFRRGVQNFLKKYSFKNAVTSELWAELQLTAGGGVSPQYNISLVMDTWTRQMGYPILSLLKDPHGGWTLTQQRWIEDRNSHKDNSTMTTKAVASPFGYKWEIPVSIEWALPGNTNTHSRLLWMRLDNKPLKLPIGGEFKWLKLNRGQFGYYRVKYEAELYKKLRPDLMTNWAPTERCGILDDAFSLAFAQYLTYDVTLEFAQVLRHEDHYIPWDCSDQHLSKLGRLLKTTAPNAYPLYRKYLLNLVQNMYNKLSWTDYENDKHLNRLLKPMIFAMACENGHTGCLNKTRQLFDKWIIAPQIHPIPPGLRDVVYKWGGSQADGEKWDKLWKIYLDEADPQERIRLLKSLAFSKEQHILRNFLERSKNETLVRRQDFFIVLKFMSANPVGNPIVWEFYRNEYNYLLKRFTINDKYFGRAVLDITDDYSSPAQLREVEAFMSVYPEAGAGSRARESGLENIRNNIRWAERNAPVIESYLKSQSFSTPLPKSISAPYTRATRAQNNKHSS